MPADLLYLSSNKNISKLFEKIAGARVPDTLTMKVLSETLGLKGTNDRPLIGALKSLGFLDQSGHPTAEYSLLKNPQTAKAAIAQGIRKAYEPVFTANENAHSLTGESLKGLIAQVAGTDEDRTNRIYSTFQALVKAADFSSALPASDILPLEQEDENGDDETPKKRVLVEGSKGLRADFHYNIQIHLPSNSTEETYLNIFNAVRKAFS